MKNVRREIHSRLYVTCGYNGPIFTKINKFVNSSCTEFPPNWKKKCKKNGKVPFASLNNLCLSLHRLLRKSRNRSKTLRGGLYGIFNFFWGV